MPDKPRDQTTHAGRRPSLPPSGPWREHLDYLFPRRHMLKLGEVATALHLSEGSIAKGCDAGLIAHHRFCCGTGKRYTVRIPRDGAILFMASHAGYEPAEVMAGILEVLKRRSRAELKSVRQHLDALLASK